MKHYNQIIERHLKDQFNISVDIDSEWEGVLLSNEEIDTQLIPEEDLKNLPNPALFHMVSYVDEKKNEWLFTLASHPDDLHKFSYALSILNGEKFASWIPNDK